MVVVLFIVSFTLMMLINWYLERRSEVSHQVSQSVKRRAEEAPAGQFQPRPVFAQDGGEPTENQEKKK